MNAAPSLSPAAEALFEQALRLSPEDRAALRRRLDSSANFETPGGEDDTLFPGPHPTASMENAVVGPNGERVPSPAFLAQLEREADDVFAGRAPSYTFEEVEAEAERLLALPEDQMPDDIRAALNAGRAAARAAGREPGR